MTQPALRRLDKRLRSGSEVSWRSCGGIFAQASTETRVSGDREVRDGTRVSFCRWKRPQQWTFLSKQASDRRQTDTYVHLQRAAHDPKNRIRPTLLDVSDQRHTTDLNQSLHRIMQMHRDQMKRGNTLGQSRLKESVTCPTYFEVLTGLVCTLYKRCMPYKTPATPANKTL